MLSPKHIIRKVGGTMIFHSMQIATNSYMIAKRFRGALPVSVQLAKKNCLRVIV
jgi:hypothetical protein